VSQPLPDGVVAALSAPDAYPDDPSAAEGVALIQTHISHLFLTRDRVYKLRKSVALSFLSFATRAERNRDCENELWLNRRLAPDVYLGIAPILAPEQARGTQAWQLGPISDELGPTELEHCVVMRRLPEGRDALSLVAQGALLPEHVDAVAGKLASFHTAHSLGAPAPWSPDEWHTRIQEPVALTFELLRESAVPGLDQSRVSRCQEHLDAFFDAHASRFEARRKAGRAVDGHGDLHLDHVWFEAGASSPVAIDCIEFDAELRRIDVAAELAFFAMDLAYRERTDLAERFLRCYAALTDDFGLYDIVDYHIIHRALVRASVAALAAEQDEVEQAQRERAASSAIHHLKLAADWLERPARGGLVLTCGTVGTGKSTVAGRAADLLGGAVISSDRTRKHLAGVAPEERATAMPGDGIYTAERTRDVYQALLERAAIVIESGRVAVLDATFSREEFRQAARDWAETRELPILLLEVRCDDALVLGRLAAREQGEHVSDAGPDFHAHSIRSFEPPSWPRAIHRVVRTDRDDWKHQLAAELQDWIAR
jgi:aminoglycoside phosphotransferase family enzyme/predicted kinase